MCRGFSQEFSGDAVEGNTLLCTTQISTDARSHFQALADRGYTIIPRAVCASSAGELLLNVRRLHAGRRRLPDAAQPFLNRGHEVLYNLQNEGVEFLRQFSRNSLVMELLRGLLNDPYYKQIPADRPNFLLRAMAARSSGNAVLPLHIDSFVPGSGRHCIACQVAIVLEDQSPETGCTLVVPGSHRSDEYAHPDAMSQAIPLETHAGDIVIWDGRLWHGALGNKTNQSRWSVIATFVRWWMKHNFDVPGMLPQSIYDLLDEDEKTMLGYCSMPPRDEFDRVDIKAGHGQLKARVTDYGRVSSGATSVATELVKLVDE